MFRETIHLVSEYVDGVLLFDADMFRSLIAMDGEERERVLLKNKWLTIHGIWKEILDIFFGV